MNKHEMMGKRVAASQIYQSDKTYKYGIRNERLIVVPFNIEGWLVGFRNIPYGNTNSDEGYFTMVVKGAVHVALVATTPFNKPYYVPLESIEIVAGVDKATTND